jgi:hypothetical protein
MAANRFTFQVNWAFCKMVDLHRDGHDYVIVLDLHEDVTVGNSATQPSALDHYQVKTDEDGQWTKARLLYRKSQKAFSILGKLYFNRINLPDLPGRLTFVTNAPLDLELAKGTSASKVAIVFSDLSDAVQKEILHNLRREHGLTEDPELQKVMCFEVTELKPGNHRMLAQGKLAELVDGFDVTGDYPVLAAYRSLADRLRCRNDYEKAPATVGELLARKSITRGDVESVLAGYKPDQTRTNLWQNEVRPDLITAGYDILQIQSLREMWNRYLVDSADRTNSALWALKEKVADAVGKVKKGGNAKTAKLIIEAVESAVTAPKAFQGNYMKAMILLEFYDTTRSISSTDSQSTGTKT